MVELWRPWIEERAGRTLSRMEKLAEDQETFGRQLRDLLKTLDLAEELAEGEREEGEDDDQEPEDGDQNSEDNTEGQDAQDQSSEDERGEGEESDNSDAAEDADADQFEADTDSDEMADSREPWRPNYNVLDHPEAFGYKVFNRVMTRKLPPNNSRQQTNWNACAPSSTRSCATCKERLRVSPIACSASSWHSRAVHGISILRRRTGRRAADPRGHRPHAPAIFQAGARCRFPRYRRHVTA